MHKKQSGGSGQYGRVIGRIEAIPEDEVIEGEPVQFVDETVGSNVSKSYVPAIKKGVLEAAAEGPLTGSAIEGVRFVLTDGNEHSVDSSEMAFKLAGAGAMRAAVPKAMPQILQPIMKVEVTVPDEFQGSVIGDINKRSGTIVDSDTRNGFCTIMAEVPLNDMFGYSSAIRAATQGKGEFTMEFSRYAPALPQLQNELVENYRKSRGGR